MSDTDRLSLDFEFKFAASSPGTFTGYGAVFGNVDSHGDVIEKGAFASSLRAWKAKGKLPPMLLQHGGFFASVDDALPVGKWISMEEDTRGLKVEGQLFALDTERGRYLHEGLKSGALDGLSIGYRAKRSVMGTRSGEPRRRLQEIDLFELSIVVFPSNDEARIGTAKARPGEVMTNPRAFERFLRAAGFPRKFAVDVVCRGFKAAAAGASDKGRREDLARAIRAAAQSIRGES